MGKRKEERGKTGARSQNMVQGKKMDWIPRSSRGMTDEEKV
jgi:hypothetical protein